MAQPPYVLRLARFDKLCEDRGIKTRTEFAKLSGLPRRTFYRVLESEPKEVSVSTIASILDVFPGTPFEYLFERTKEAA